MEGRYFSISFQSCFPGMGLSCAATEHAAKSIRHVMNIFISIYFIVKRTGLYCRRKV
jgi:hypothetical protein